MKRIQKMIFISGIMIASIFFLYTLSFSTGWAKGEDALGEFFVQAQYVNKLIYNWALWTVVFAGLNILFNSHKNINFYALNYVVIALLLITLVGSGITTLLQVPPLKSMYLEKQDALYFLTIINLSKISTNIFDYGVYLSLLMFIQAGLIIFITVYKTSSQIKRAKIKKLKRMGYADENS